jgi:autotransporter-associated beta strand protein
LDDQTTTGVKYAGAITGPGGLTVSGGAGVNDPATAPYLLILDGQANSYTGNTLIDNATVANDNAPTGGNHLPATTVLTLVNNGVYSIYRADANGITSQTLAGLVGDSTALLGTENNSAPTIFTINTATGTSYTYAGRIADVQVLGRGQILVGGAPVSIVKDGAGTQILTGDNPYAGTTTINDGILQIGDGGDTGTLGTGAVIDNALLVFNRGDNLDVPNAISGIGTVTNNGDTANVLTLSGPQDYAVLNADSGTTNVTGSFTAGTATVNVDATLNFGADETIDTLNIGADGVVTLGVIAPAPLAPTDGNEASAQLGNSSPLASDSDMSQSGAPVVPEPGAMSLLLLGMLSLFGRRPSRAR